MKSINEIKKQVDELVDNSSDIKSSKNNYKKILELIEKVPELERNYELKKLYSLALVWDEKYNEAYNKIIEIKNMGKNDSDWYCTMASIYFNLQDYENAIKYINIAIKLDSKNEMYNEMLELYSHFG
jgi:tetratricopeptide (TPR) repeat protein